MSFSLTNIQTEQSTTNVVYESIAGQIPIGDGITGSTGPRGPAGSIGPQG